MKYTVQINKLTDQVSRYARLIDRYKAQVANLNKDIVKLRGDLEAAKRAYWEAQAELDRLRPMARTFQAIQIKAAVALTFMKNSVPEFRRFMNSGYDKWFGVPGRKSDEGPWYRRDLSKTPAKEWHNVVDNAFGYIDPRETLMGDDEKVVPYFVGLKFPAWLGNMSNPYDVTGKAILPYSTDPPNFGGVPLMLLGPGGPAQPSSEWWTFAGMQTQHRIDYAEFMMRWSIKVKDFMDRLFLPGALVSSLVDLLDSIPPRSRERRHSL